MVVSDSLQFWGKLSVNLFKFYAINALLVNLTFKSELPLFDKFIFA